MCVWSLEPLILTKFFPGGTTEGGWEQELVDFARRALRNGVTTRDKSLPWVLEVVANIVGVGPLIFSKVHKILHVIKVWGSSLLVGGSIVLGQRWTCSSVREHPHGYTIETQLWKSVHIRLNRPECCRWYQSSSAGESVVVVGTLSTWCSYELLQRLLSQFLLTTCRVHVAVAWSNSTKWSLVPQEGP